MTEVAAETTIKKPILINGKDVSIFFSSGENPELLKSLTGLSNLIKDNPADNKTINARIRSISNAYGINFQLISKFFYS